MAETERRSTTKLTEPARFLSVPFLVPSAAWVYGGEGNENFVKSLDPLKNEAVSKVKFNVRFSCMHNWFLRSCWYSKLHYLIHLLELSKGLGLLEKLLTNINSIGTKDVVSILSQQSGASLYDRVPLDDNRALDLETLQHVRDLDKVWFESLDEDEQLEILQGLLSVEGGALTFRVFFEAYRLYLRRVRVSRLLRNFKVEEYKAPESEDVQQPEEKLPKKKSKKEKAPKKEKKPAKTKSPPKEMSPSKDKDTKEEKTADQSDPSLIEIRISSEIKKRLVPQSREEEAIAAELAVLKAKWKTQIRNLLPPMTAKSVVKDNKKAKKEGKEEKKEKKEKKGKKGKGDDTDKDGTLDWLQLFPPSINRRVCRLLDKPSADVAQKVNKYWAFMLEETKKEMETRNKLNEFIGELEDQTERLRSHQIRSGHGSYASPRQSLQVYSTPSSSSSSSKEEVPLVNNDDLIKRLNIPSPYNSEVYNDAFLHMHDIYTVINDFIPRRVMICEPEHLLMAVTGENYSVDFYSLRHGRKLDLHLEGHDNKITCMAFHSNLYNFFTGSTDGTIRRWHIWSCTATKIYKCHKDQINSLSVCDEYLVSGGRDKQLNVFHLCSGICISTMTDDHSITAITIQNKNNYVFSGCKNGEIKVFDISTRTLKLTLPEAHEREITCLCLASPILLSSSFDGYVKVWCCESLESLALLSLYHHCPVTAVTLCGKRILTGCQNGHLRIWKLEDGSLVRKSEAMPFYRPIFDIGFIQERNNIKVIISGDTLVKVHEFHPRSNKNKKAKPAITDGSDNPKYQDIIFPVPKRKVILGLRKSSIYKGNVRVERVTTNHQRIESLDAHVSTDRSLRYPMDTPSNAKSIITDCFDDERQMLHVVADHLAVFPRIAVTRDIPGMIHSTLSAIGKLQTERSFEVSRIGGHPLHQSRFGKVPKKITHKHSLRLNNVFKKSL